jgi:DNA-binding IclR family transcriptional regulator
MVTGARGGASQGESSVMRSLQRGLRVLAEFTGDRPQWALTEMSQQVHLNVATTHRILKTLTAEGFLTHDASTGKYHLGPAAARMGYVVESHDHLARMAHPYLETLAEETGEIVDLAVDANGLLLIVDEILTRNPFKPNLPVGRAVECLAKASGKVFLAFKPPALRAELSQDKLIAHTPNTITDPQAYEDELARIARVNLGFDNEEDGLGVCAVASAVRDGAGRVECAFQVVAPKERFGADDVEKYVQALRRAVNDFSAFLGCAPR